MHISQYITYAAGHLNNGVARKNRVTALKLNFELDFRSVHFQSEAIKAIRQPPPIETWVKHIFSCASYEHK